MNTENPESNQALTHLDNDGQVHMVDVSDKPPMKRTAIAVGYFLAAESTLDKVLSEGPKGEALATARLAGIQAAKRTDELIPLCHSLPLSQVSVDLNRIAHASFGPTIEIKVTVSTIAGTGVEMEALTGVSIAALTLYDMTKAVDKQLRIEGIRLLEKTKVALPA